MQIYSFKTKPQRIYKIPIFNIVKIMIFMEKKSNINDNYVYLRHKEPAKPPFTWLCSVSDVIFLGRISVPYGMYVCGIKGCYL